MTTDHTLKAGFSTLFPDYARQLDAATTQEETEQLHESFVLTARHDLAAALGKDLSTYTDTENSGLTALRKKTYELLINATGDGIKQQFWLILDGLTRLKNIDREDKDKIVAQLLESGVLGLGLVCTTAVGEKLAAGADEAAAAYYGLEAGMDQAIQELLTLILLLVIIPPIYMLKPASCYVLLINELDQPLTFVEDYSVHGKPVLITAVVPKAVVAPDGSIYPSAGFIATQKRDGALSGSQYGFVMQYGSNKLAYGVECPLTNFSVYNNCYCAIGETAEEAANTTEKYNRQFFEDAKDGIKVSISANSASGSIAYYIARAYR